MTWHRGLPAGFVIDQLRWAKAVSMSVATTAEPTGFGPETAGRGRFAEGYVGWNPLRCRVVVERWEGAARVILKTQRRRDAEVAEEEIFAPFASLRFRKAGFWKLGRIHRCSLSRRFISNA